MGLDYYEILSLQRTATTADVQKAYRKLALKHHPDRSANEESIAVFSLISEAYDVLCNPKTKGFYDLYGEEGIKYGVTDGKGTKKGGFYACSTSAYRLHYFESASGLRFVLTTDLAATDMREALRHIYSQIYVECLTKNPLYTPGEPITCSLFTQTLERYVSSL